MSEQNFLECIMKTYGALMMLAKVQSKRNGADLEKVVVLILFNNSRKLQIAQWLNIQLQSKKEFEWRNDKVNGLINRLKITKQNNLKWENGDKIRNIERQINNFLINEEIY